MSTNEPVNQWQRDIDESLRRQRSEKALSKPCTSAEALRMAREIGELLVYLAEGLQWKGYYSEHVVEQVRDALYAHDKLAEQKEE
jgi:hypothetical protein